MIRRAFVLPIAVPICLMLSSGTVYALCTSSLGVNTTSQYIQNATITCSGSVTVTPLNGALAGYGWGSPLAAPKISAQTSQVLRWTNATSATTLVTKVNGGAILTGSGLTRPMLFSRTGYYTQNGDGTTVVAPWITPNARPTITIINDGIVRYTGTTTSAFDWGAAAGIDADDSPVDQYLNNSGTLSSTSGWSTIIRDFATGGVFGLEARDASSYAYSYNNIINVTNTGSIIQIGASPSAAGPMASHSSALQLIVISAKEVSVINSGTISGTTNGVDILTTTLVSNAYIENSGLIHGDTNAVNLTPLVGNVAPGIKSIPIYPYLKTLTNYSSGTIDGGSVGVNIASGSIVEVINNAGTITGFDYSIKNAGSLSVVNHSGILNGNVMLGGAWLNILGNSASILGTTMGDGASIINIGTASQTGVFSSGFTSEAGRINVFSGSRLALADGVNWRVLSGDANAISNRGEIELANASRLTGNVSNSGILLMKTGNIASADIAGNLINSGSLRVGSSNLQAGNILTINGDYSGQGGVIFLNTMMADDSSATDRLVVTGNTSGTSSVRVRNVGGAGALTGEGIEIINVRGVSAGIFDLIGDEIYQNRQVVVAGAYAYGLYKGNASGTDLSSWYLRSQSMATKPIKPTPLLTPAAQTYETYPSALLALNRVPTLQQRTGNRFWNAGDAAPNAGESRQDTAATKIETSGVWGRIEGGHSNIHSKISTSGVDFSQNYVKFQSGITGLLAEYDNTRLVGEIFGQYGHANTQVDSRNPFGWGNGRIATDGYSLGGTLTWYQQGGFYLDGLAQANWYQSDLFGSGSKVYTRGNHSFGYTLSLEAGQRIAFGAQWSTTPQAQIVYSSVRFDRFTDVYGTPVRLDDAASLQGRIGATLDYENVWKDTNSQVKRLHIYGIGNLYYEFLNGTKVSIDTLGLTNRNDRLWVGLGTGGSYNWDNDRYSLYGEAQIATSLRGFGDSYSLNGQVGFRMKF